MAHNFREVRGDIIKVLNLMFDHNTYLMKGGQAIAFHFQTIQASTEARFSRDIDLSFSSPTFPLALKEFCSSFERLYNSQTRGALLIREVKPEKLPKGKAAYFGVRLLIKFGEKNARGRAGHIVLLKDIDSTRVVIDCTCNEYVEDVVILNVGGLKVANVSLIVAEKYRALCSHMHDPELNPLPRAKDFYDLFAIYIVCFGNGNPPLSALAEIKDLLQKCFAIKNMPLSLLKNLESEKAFHAINFQEQVLDTLEPGSRFKTIAFDQAFSQALEFLDKILAS